MEHRQAAFASAWTVIDSVNMTDPACICTSSPWCPTPAPECTPVSIHTSYRQSVRHCCTPGASHFISFWSPAGRRFNACNNSIAWRCVPAPTLLECSGFCVSASMPDRHPRRLLCFHKQCCCNSLSPVAIAADAVTWGAHGRLLEAQVKHEIIKRKKLDAVA
jgi:hypothetical protein